MRNLEAESKLVIRLAQFVGALFLLGLMAIAVGTELLILGMWESNPAGFWIWQGVWAVVHAVIMSAVVGILKAGLERI